MGSKEVTFEQTLELFEFLQGNAPDEILIVDHPKLTKEVAFNVIWFLQEHMGIIPSNYEQCKKCKELFDDHHSGCMADYCDCDGCGCQYDYDSLENGCDDCPEMNTKKVGD